MTDDDFYGPQIRIISFGFLHDIPATSVGALLVDLRTELLDPHVDPAMRELTGLDDAVISNVLEQLGAFELISRTADQAEALAAVNNPRNRITTVLAGCQGGRHRSVVIATALHDTLVGRGHCVELEHRHIDRPVVQR